MKLSFCTVSKDRLEHLKLTLPANIEDNKRKDVEFVVLNYNSSDAIDDYIRKNYMSEIKAGILTYYKEETQKFFLPSHSRNLCMRLATGEIVCNVDADNFTGPSFDDFIISTFQKTKKKTIVCSPYMFKQKELNTHGRIAVLKKDWIWLGGYDEDMLGFGGEDWDLVGRYEKRGWRIVKFPKCHCHYIKHSDALRLRHIDLSDVEKKYDDRVNPNNAINKIVYGIFETFNDASLYHKRRFSSRTNAANLWEKTRRNITIRNQRKTWGCGTVIKNFEEIIHVKALYPFF